MLRVFQGSDNLVVFVWCICRGLTVVFLTILRSLKMSEKNRNRIISVRVSPGEVEAIRVKAGEFALTPAVWLRMIALQAAIVPVAPVAEKPKTEAQLKKEADQLVAEADYADRKAKSDAWLASREKEKADKEAARLEGMRR